jgi:2-haloacid dehalogenase
MCFVSSNAWDAHASADFGFRSVWVNRAGAPRERLPGELAAEIRSLHELPALLGL